MHRKHYPLDWYYSPLWHHKHVFAAGILTFLWWVWLFPLFFYAVKEVFPNFQPFTFCMFGMWLLAMLIVFGLWKGRLKPNEIEEDHYLHLLEEAEKKRQKQENETPKIVVEESSSSEDGHHGSSPTVSVSNTGASAQNTPALYSSRTGRESMDYEYTHAANMLISVANQSNNNPEEVELKQEYDKHEETSSSSSSSEDIQQQTELSVDDESDIASPRRITEDKTLTPRQIFFSDLLRYSEEPVTRDRRSYYMNRPQLTLAEKRKSMPLYLYIGETRTLSYTDQEAVTEDVRRNMSTSDSDKYSLSSPAQHITSDELRSNMSRFRDEQQSPGASSNKEKHSSSSSGAEYFIANVSQQKSVTSEVFITIDEPQASVNRNVNEFELVGDSDEEAKLVAVINMQKITNGDNDDALSDCVFLDEVSTAK